MTEHRVGRHARRDPDTVDDAHVVADPDVRESVWWGSGAESSSPYVLGAESPAADPLGSDPLLPDLPRTDTSASFAPVGGLPTATSASSSYASDRYRAALDAPAAVEVVGLTKTYGNRRVVDEVDFEVPTGTVLGLLGPNGAGKTTIVRMMATLLRPDAGRITVLGRDVVSDATAVRSVISLTGQYASVDNDLTALENLDIYGRLVGLKGAQSRRRAAELVEQFGLAEAAKRPIQHYSGGMRRRLDLAASMIRRPALLFLDEPTTGLDPRTRTQLWEIVRDVVAAGTTVVLTTQYLDEADALADQLVVIDHGRVVGRGTPETLKKQVGSFSLSIRLTDQAAAQAAADTITALLGHAPDLDRRTGELTAPVPDSARAAQVIAALSDQRITVDEFGVHAPSLDDVFLALTEERRPA